MKWLALLMLVSCSSQSVGWKNVDERLWPYLISYEKESNTKLPKDIYFQFKPLKNDKGKPSKASAVCYYRKKKMFMNSNKWYKFDKLTIESIVFHEIGHCHLRLKHSSMGFLKKEQCPTSIMHWQGASVNNCYERHREYYIRELFFRSEYAKKKYRINY